MKIGGQPITGERLEQLRVLCGTPGLDSREIARRFGCIHGHLSVWKAAARRRGIPIPFTYGGKRKSQEMCARWQSLADNTASEWGRADVPRCRCGLMLPCAVCIPDEGRELQTARPGA